MFTLVEEQDLSTFSTFRMQSTAHYFAIITDARDLPDAYAFAESHAVPVIILGGGSNTIFASSYIEALVLKVSIPGFEIVSEDNESATFRFGAGEIWDEVVLRTVEMRYSGLEALSAIPGSVGGTPVQNVGAYGQEVGNLIVSLEAYDTVLGGQVTFLHEDCEFAYRDSTFKHGGRDRFVILSVDFKLSKLLPTVPNYPGVTAYFEKQAIASPTLSDIRNAIIEIRKNKLPDPREIASVGSFFKNPFVTLEKAAELKAQFPSIVMFPVDTTQVKVGAGWLIDSLGLKGKEFGNLMLYPNNALVIVNKGGATYDELAELISTIQTQVHDTFGVDIEPEPIIVE